MAAVNAGAIELAHRLQKLLNAAMADETLTVDDVRRLSPSLDNYLRVARQIDRYSLLESRLVESRRRVTEAKERLQMTVLQGVSQDAMRRNRQSIPPARW